MKHRPVEAISCVTNLRFNRFGKATRGRWKALSSISVAGWSGSAAVGGWLIATCLASREGFSKVNFCFP